MKNCKKSKRESKISKPAVFKVRYLCDKFMDANEMASNCFLLDKICHSVDNSIHPNPELCFTLRKRVTLSAVAPAIIARHTFVFKFLESTQSMLFIKGNISLY